MIKSLEKGFISLCRKAFFQITDCITKEKSIKMECIFQCMVALTEIHTDEQQFD